MSDMQHQKSEENGGDDFSEDADRPDGTIDRHANPPPTEPTRADVQPDADTFPPQDTRSPAQSYEAR
jgi:hypothetical protein